MKHQEIGLWVYTPTERDWTARLLESGVRSVSEGIEEELLEFVHSDVTVEVWDGDGVASTALMGMLPTAKWTASLWRNGHVTGSEILLFSGTIDALSIVRDYERERVSFRILSNSKQCDLSSAESVKRTVTSRTGTVTAGSTTVTVNSATDIEVDDEIEIASGGIKESHKVIQKSASTLITKEAWTNAFAAQPLTLLTPYWRGKTPAFLATELYKAAGFLTPNVTAPDLALDDPIPLRMNSAGLSRTGVTTLSKRGSNIAAFENGASYYATSATSGFALATYTPVRPADWTAYGAPEPSPHVDIGVADNGIRVSGKSTAYYWYGRETTTPGPTSTNFKLELVRSDGVAVMVHQRNYNNDLGWSARFDFWVEYNPAETMIWISWRCWEIPDDPLLESIIATGCNAYTPAMAGNGSRATAAARQLRAVLNTKMATYTDTEFQLINAVSAWNVTLTLEYRSNVKLWTLRYIAYDGIPYLMAIRYYGTAWYLVVWSYTTGAVVYEELLTSGAGPAPPAVPIPYGAIWYDSVGTDDVYVGYVPTVVGGGYYFYVSKAGTGTVEYADFTGDSVSSGLKKVAAAAASIVWVDANGAAFFTPRAKLGQVFGTTPTALSVFYEKRKTNIWESYRSSCAVRGTDLATETDFEALYGDTGNTSFRLSIDAPFVSSPAVAKALAKQYVGFFNKTDGAFEIEVDEAPLSGLNITLRPMKLVSFDGANYRLFRVTSNFVSKRQALLAVKE